ncbi:MAG: N-acetylglucosamine-6-phosphate deacetylase [Clostridia bacterium]|nr:N-acetylglucosamine-6-phosphate deacetylase [Clostridia bacterium]
MKYFENVDVYVENSGIVKTSVVFDEKIKYIGADGRGIEKIELPVGATVLPGFIDEHIHGAGGADAMDATVAALETIDKTLAREGTTRFLATTMTQSKENILKAVNSIKSYKAQGDTGLLGIHLEGPFISSLRAGAQPEKYILKPDVEFFKEINDASGGLVKLVTLAPEIERADELITYLTEKGVTVSVGHSDATYNQTINAVNLGARCVTHTFNAQTGIHHRDLGVAGAAVTCEKLSAEIISDTVHVSIPAIKLLAANKDKDKLILITDAMRAKGLADRESELGGQTVYVKNGQARLKDGTLAGSVLKMNEAIKNLYECAGVNFLQSIDCATINPAKNLGVEKDYGSIKIGKVADFTVIDKDFSVLLTVRDGKIIYKNY